LQEAGFILKFKPTIHDADGKIKGNVDADMVLSVMTEWSNFEKAVMVSSDGDFYSLVEHLNKSNKLETVLSPDKNNCSTLLQKSAKDKIDIWSI
jgi:uncharacterized LabA/DUF88 family protein